MIHKLPTLEDVFIAVMASFIGFGLVVGVTQAAVGSSDEVLSATSSVATQTSDLPRGVTACPAGETLHLSPNYASGTGYCIKLKDAVQRLAGNSSTTPAAKKLLDGQCMVTAVTKRDTAIGAGLDAYHTAISAALTKRTADLSAAWLLSGRPERKAAIKKAWAAFQTAVKTATRTLTAAKKSAWLQFGTDRKSCGTYATSDDSMTRGVDTNL